MNERIKELADQADQYARSDNSAMLFENFQKRYTEKLAEMIVRECAKVCDEHKKSLENGWKNGLGVASDLIETCESCSTSIKQHFGVDSVSKPEPPQGRVFKGYN